MTSSFSIQRVFLLIQKQWIENSRFYILALLAMLGIIALLVAIFFLQIPGLRYSEEALFQVYFYGLFIFGALLASLSFSPLSQKENGLNWLSLPASHAEKLTCTIFYTTVVFFIGYNACFFSVSSLAIIYAKENLLS